MKTLGKIAGGLGLLLSLTSFLTLFITSGSLNVFLVKLGLGLLLLVLWGVTNWQGLAAWTRSAFFYSSSFLIAAVFVGLLAGVNFIAAKRAPSWDLTRKKIYSLSAQTVSTLQSLKKPVRLLVFVDGTLPTAVEDLFRRYEALSDQFSYELKNPRKTPGLTLKYSIRSGQSAAVLVTGEGGGTHTILSLSRLGSPQLGEQELTNGLIKLNTVGAQKLYFTQGHGEWPLEPLSQGREASMASLGALKRILQDEGYTPEALNIVTHGKVPEDASAVVICGARSSFTQPEKQALSTFLNQGGRLVYLAEVGGGPGLEALLAQYGVHVEEGLVADARVNPEQPFMVITPFFGQHEITRPLSQLKTNVVLPTTHALTILTEDRLPGVEATPILLSTQYAWLEADISENPTLDSHEKSGQLPLGVAITRDTSSEKDKKSDEARIVVFGDSELMASALGYKPNRDLALNAIAWATMQTQHITIRPPDRDISTVDVSPDVLFTIRLLSMDVLPMLLIGIGLAVWLTRRAR